MKNEICISKKLANMVIIMDNYNLDYYNVNNLALAWSGACQLESEYYDEWLNLNNFKTLQLKSNLYVSEDTSENIRNICNEYINQAKEFMEEFNININTTWEEFDRNILKNLDTYKSLRLSYHNLYKKELITPFIWILLTKKSYKNKLTELRLVDIKIGKYVKDIIKAKYMDYTKIQLNNIESKLAYCYLFEEVQHMINRLEVSGLSKVDIEILFNNVIRNYKIY